MNIIIEIPATLERSLQDAFGPDVAGAARQALAIAWYQAEKLSIGQVAQLLGISVYEADGLMKQHHVDAPYSLEDFQRDRETLRKLLNP